jgi:hypothetical protein
MSVASLTVCVWSSQARQDSIIEKPLWAEIEQSIRGLNNADRNDIYLYPTMEAPETWLAVGGGNGSYVVTGSIDAERHPFLPNVAGSETEFVELCVGGQVGEYPSRQVVSLESTLCAVNRFYEAGGFDCGVVWEFS